jgi:hypothetical protein
MARLNTLYVPRDQNDTQAKTSLMNELRDTRNLRLATSRVVSNEQAGEACDWIVQLRLEWQDGFGRGSDRSVQMRMRLEFAGEQVRAARLFGVVRQ